MSNSHEPDKSWQPSVRHASISDVGMRRAINQDAMSVILRETRAGWERLGHLFLVADGMGAHAAGELASQLAIDLIPHHYQKLRDMTPAEALHRAIAEANAEIFRRGQANIEFRSMGTTCSLLCLLPEGAVVAHVGDSRVYQQRGDKIYQLTFDHSLVWEMRAAGEVTDETARSGVIPKNVITRSLGPNVNVQIDIEGPFPVKRGDRFLLCSDGLSGQLSDEEIGELMRTLEPQEATRAFVDIANLRGGPDNITAVVVEVTDEAIATASPGSIPPRRAGPRKRFSTALGVVTAVCFGAAIILSLLSLIPLAIVAMSLGLFALLTGLVQVFWMADGAVEATDRYGNGPYRQYRAVPSRSFFEQLSSTVRSLKEAALEREWKIDWAPIDQRVEEADRHAEAGAFEQAIRVQSQVIVDVMGQIRRQRQLQGDDSAIDL